METLKEKYMLGYSRYGVIGGIVGVTCYAIGFIAGYIHGCIQLIVKGR